MQKKLSELLCTLAPIRAKINEGYSVNSLLPQGFAHLEAQDRAIAQAILYRSIRRTGRLRFVLSRLCNRRPTAAVTALLEVALAALELGNFKSYTVVAEAVNAAKLEASTRSATGFVNAILRNFLRQSEELQKRADNREDCRLNAPAWWIKVIRRAHPETADQILALAQEPPPMTLRVNTARTTVAAFRTLLDEQKIANRVVGAEAIQLLEPKPVDAVPGFADGLCSVQDAGAQLAAHLLPVKDGDRVLDACAAPGGKTAHLLERFRLDMTALEIDTQRTRRIHENLDRLGLSARVLTADALDINRWWDGKPFDAIVLDAPCTASGVVRRQPDTPWLRRENDIALLAAQQKKLLEALWPLLRQGGHLLYITCSIFPEEGLEQMRAFLARHKDASLVPLCQDNHGMMILLPRDEPHELGAQMPSVNDGFFYTLLTKGTAVH